MNYRTGNSDSDERVYARAAARAGGIELHEVKGSIAKLQGSDLPPSFRPLPNLALRPLHVALDGLARQRGARALVDGAGGDNVFCYLTTAAPILDAYRMNGWSGARMALHDIARLCETTWWDALAATLRRARRRRRRLWNADHRFLHPDAQPACPDDHPWLSYEPGILPGKYGHIEALVTIQHFVDRGQPLISVPMIHPLLAQPLMELCLRIPSFLWSRSGINRAVARDAMRGLVPLLVANRRTKGGLGSMFLMTFMHNRLALRDYLMDGTLASRGLLDLAALDTVLSRPDEPADDCYVRILEIAALEDWLRSWRR